MGTGSRGRIHATSQTLVEALGNIQTVLADAEPQDKAEVYRRLGMQLTYEPGKQVVRAEVALDPPATHAGRLRSSRRVFVAVPLRDVVRDGAA